MLVNGLRGTDARCSVTRISRAFPSMCYPPGCFGGRARGRSLWAASAFSDIVFFMSDSAPGARTIPTYAYVDAFNLYYGCLRGTSYKWLNLHRMLEALLPKNDIRCIKYFTAKITPRPSDPTAAVRQQTYLRALRTLPKVEIAFGHYLTHTVKMLLASPAPGGPRVVEVIKTEEKGSDVNLATHLISDAYEKRFQCAVVVTNDSDLTLPVARVRELGYAVGVVNPHERAARTLQQAASFTRQIREGLLRVSQFPTELTDSAGTFTRPSSW